jgi:hypothetical protein
MITLSVITLTGFHCVTELILVAVIVIALGQNITDHNKQVITLIKFAFLLFSQLLLFVAFGDIDIYYI